MGHGRRHLATPSGGDLVTPAGSRWLPLLRRLTKAAPEWAVWKNVDSALEGSGDIDSAAPVADWKLIEHEFRRWASEQMLGPVVVCPHIPGGLNLIAVDPQSRFLLEMSVKQRKVWRGSALFEIEDLLPLFEMDPRGFRRLVFGAEGVLKLLLNGTRRGGRPDWEAIRAKKVVELIRQDPAGVRKVAPLFGWAQRALLRGADSVTTGRWDRRAMSTIEARALLRALKDPGGSIERLRFRLKGQNSCLVVRTLLTHQRRIQGDRDRWLEEVVRTHDIDQPVAMS